MGPSSGISLQDSSRRLDRGDRGGATATRRSGRWWNRPGPPTAWWAAGLLAAAALVLVRSGGGLVLGLALLGAALLYGRWAAASQDRARRRRADVQGLRQLTGAAFEHHVAETFTGLGYRTELTRGSGDQGADVIAVRGAERLAIQCKQWADAVGNEAVQQALGARGYYDCTAAMVVCTSRFTASAQELARRNGVRLVDGPGYARLMASVAPPPARGGARRTWLPGGRPLLYQSALALAAVVAIGAAHGGPSTPPVATDAAAPAAAACAVYAAGGGLDYYAYAGERVLAPPGWGCRVQEAGGATTIWAAGADGSVTLESGCAACVAAPASAADAPGGERVVALGPHTVAFEDPPGLIGDGVPSGGSEPANGAVVFGTGHTAKATCTLPPADHSLCTRILNAFLKDQTR